MSSERVAVLGGTSLVGHILLDLLIKNGFEISAFTRQKLIPAHDGLNWLQLLSTNTPNQLDNGANEWTVSGSEQKQINNWISVAPIWVLPDHFQLFENYGIKRIVALSSTSVFIKGDSSDPHEKDVASRLSAGEKQLESWATTHGVQWIILRPTLIYGHNKDKNISEIAKFIRRFKFFPIFGRACGLRQPVHAEDVALACVAALQNYQVKNHSYNLSGGETLSYRDMVARVFSALNIQPRMLSIPLWLFRIAITLLHTLPRFHHWNTAMAERMNRDLCFDHTEATKDFGYSPRDFDPNGDI